MRSVIDFLADMNTSLSLYHLISTDLIRLLQNPLVSPRTGLSSGPSVQGGGCRMLGRRCSAGSRGVSLLGPGRGLRLGPCSLGPVLGASRPAWGLGTPWRSGRLYCSCNIYGPWGLLWALLGPRFCWMVLRLVGLRSPCFIG